MIEFFKKLGNGAYVAIDPRKKRTNFPGFFL
jgi:hypothetical protein